MWDDIIGEPEGLRSLDCTWQCSRFCFQVRKMHFPYRLIIFKDTKAKCRHQEKLTCKGTLRQVFITVYRLEIHSVMLVFSTQLCKLLPLLPSLCFISIPPPFPV